VWVVCLEVLIYHTTSTSIISFYCTNVNVYVDMLHSERPNDDEILLMSLLNRFAINSASRDRTRIFLIGRGEDFKTGSTVFNLSQYVLKCGFALCVDDDDDDSSRKTYSLLFLLGLFSIFLGS
jgi:hypothetical protein